jgi:hypothetical protein
MHIINDVKSIQRAAIDVADLCKTEPYYYSRQRQFILIESIAFIDGWDDDLDVPSDLELGNDSTNEEGSRKRTLQYLSRRGIEYAQGSMMNRSGEPEVDPIYDHRPVGMKVVVRSTFKALHHKPCMDFKESCKIQIRLVQLLLLLVPPIRCKLSNLGH